MDPQSIDRAIHATLAALRDGGHTFSSCNNEYQDVSASGSRDCSRWLSPLRHRGQHLSRLNEVGSVLPDTSTCLLTLSFQKLPACSLLG